MEINKIYIIMAVFMFLVLLISRSKFSTSSYIKRRFDIIDEKLKKIESLIENFNKK